MIGAYQQGVICRNITCSSPIVTCDVSNGRGMDVDNDIKEKFSIAAGQTENLRKIHLK